MIAVCLFAVVLMKVWNHGWLSGFNERDGICKKYHSPERLSYLCR